MWSKLNRAQWGPGEGGAQSEERRGQLQRGAGVLGCLEGETRLGPDGALRLRGRSWGLSCFPPSNWSGRIRAAELKGLSALLWAGHTGPREGCAYPQLPEQESRSAQGQGLAQGHRAS